MPSVPATLCFTGVLLFLAGLLTGFALPRMRSPRLGLSSHLAGLQSGTFLIAVGLLWPKLGLPGLVSAVVGHVLWISLYSLWLSLLLAGLFGAGGGLPIAGQGATTTPAKQAAVTALLGAGALACTAAIVAVLVEWRWWV